MATIYTVWPEPQMQHSMSVDEWNIHGVIADKVDKHCEAKHHCLVRIFVPHDGPTGQIFSHAYYCRDGVAKLWNNSSIPSALFNKHISARGEDYWWLRSVTEVGGR